MTLALSQSLAQDHAITMSAGEMKTSNFQIIFPSLRCARLRFIAQNQLSLATEKKTNTSLG